MKRLTLVFCLFSTCVLAQGQVIKLTTPSSGNATVPNNAPIQPPQAFVDVAAKFVYGAHNSNSTTANASGAGITTLGAGFPVNFAYYVTNFLSSVPTLDCSNNALSTASVDAILTGLGALSVTGTPTLKLHGGSNATPTGGAESTALWTLLSLGSPWHVLFNIHGTSVDCDPTNQSFNFSGNSMTAGEVTALLTYIAANWSGDIAILDLSGGTTAAPTGGAIDAALWDVVNDKGWGVKFNLHGAVVSLYLDGVTYDYSGNSMSASEVNALLAFVVANYPSLALTLKIDGGTNAAPTGQGLTDKATLIGNGWTVTTN